MTSGRGILHEEMPRRSENGNIYGFQLWVNLPAAQKMSQPRYQEVNESGIPVIEKDGCAIPPAQAMREQRGRRRRCCPNRPAR